MLCSAYNFVCPSDHCTQLHAMTTGEAGTCTTASAWLVPLQLCSVRLHASEIHTPLQVALLTSNSISIFVETLREFPSPPPPSVLVLLVCGKASQVTRGTFAVSSFFPFPSLPFPSLPFPFSAAPVPLQIKMLVRQLLEGVKYLHEYSAAVVSAAPGQPNIPLVFSSY